MIKRNDVPDIPVENENDKARISIKKGLLTVGCLLAVVACAISFKSYWANAQARESERKVLQDAIDSLEIPYWRQPSAGFGADAVADMTVAGMDVARFQNAYFGSDEDGILEIQKQLHVYFDSVSGELIWFYPGLNAGELSWQYETGSGIESGAGQGIWTLLDSEGMLCAYSVADYDTKSGKFGTVACHVTTHGYEQSSAVDIPDAGLCEDEDYDEYYDFVNDPDDRYADFNREVSGDGEEATRE